MRKIIVLLFFTLLLSCRNNNSIELSGGYFLRMEGKNLNDILPRDSGLVEIPSNVILYGYNTGFIIAKQKPSKEKDPLYRDVIYKDGKDTTYYWLIVHNQKLVLGPMREAEYIQARKKYNVPDDLKLQKLDWME